ncbi:hypothetical protein [Streptomyces sp. NBRC 109706]|uniref:hypothetical protein n=1 Tax=Streptomyces sp. NBRC 109706 TaxID=1550035 RepID=UPI00131D05C9|nr:hypothetical protein [Streptomyces sp. NBRC 109706]
MDDAMETVDQYVFRWDAENSAGGTGFGVVAWSGERSDAADVQRALASTLDVAGENTIPGLVRIERGHRVLLGRRTLGLDPGGRAGTVCHALVGHRSVLPPITCLALHDWRWQQDELPVETVRGGLPPVPTEPLTHGRDEELFRLTDELREPTALRTLVALTAEVLRDPNRRFSVLDLSGGREPHTVLLGLWRLFGPLLGGQPLGWSFATHDSDYAKRLRFTFLTAWPTHPSSNERHVRVDPRKQTGDRAEQLARVLVDLSLAEEGGGNVSRTLERRAPQEETRRNRKDWLLRTAERALSRTPQPVQRSSPPRRTQPTPEPRPQAAAGPGPQAAAGPTEGAAPSADLRALRLIRAVRESDFSDPSLRDLIAPIAAEHPHWSRDLQLRYCHVLLEHRLFLRAGLADTEERSAVEVARLYRQAVKPFADERQVAATLATILPEETERTRSHPIARPALDHILKDGAGVSEAVWYQILKVWHPEEPPRPPRPPAPPTPSPPRTSWDQPPSHPAPTHPTTTHRDRRPWLPEVTGVGMVGAAIVACLVTILVLTILATR